MTTRVDRDALYCDCDMKDSENLRCVKEAPRHKRNRQNKGYPCPFLGTDRKGSVTVEAAFCVPAFFLVVFSLFYLFQFLFFQNEVQNSLANAAREYSCYGTKIESGKNLLSGGPLLLWKEDNTLCYTKTTKTIPCMGSRFFKLHLYQQICCSAYQGKTMVSQEHKASEEYVYLAEHGTVYHRSESCTYLNPSVQSITFVEIGTKRNASGGKYYPCKRCVKKSPVDIVYYTEYGSRYHSSPVCSEIKRNIRKVRLSEIGDFPACSKCGF